jgi:poly(hydroxyalkanoate) depolymerase family esterase
VRSHTVQAARCCQGQGRLARDVVAQRGGVPMSKRLRKSPWAKMVERSVVAFTRSAVKSGSRNLAKALKPAVARRTPPPGAGAWLPGVALSAAGARRFRLYRPPDVTAGERLPLMVMLHGCGQDANSFAASTRMNRVAQRERFLVLYPEQDRLSNPQGCWNWYDTSSGRAFGEAALILKAIDQVCLLYPVDRTRVVIAGLSAGASMAALLASRHPDRFKAVAAHNGQAAAQVWADAAGAKPGAVRRVQRGARYPMSVTDFKRRGSTVATLVLIDQLAHAWSGGAASQPFSDARGPDASRMAWAFAARQLRV